MDRYAPEDAFADPRENEMAGLVDGEVGEGAGVGREAGAAGGGSVPASQATVRACAYAPSSEKSVGGRGWGEARRATRGSSHIDRGRCWAACSHRTRSARVQFRFACLSELQGHEGAVHACPFSPTGQLLASASFDMTVRVWDVR